MLFYVFKVFRLDDADTAGSLMAMIVGTGSWLTVVIAAMSGVGWFLSREPTNNY